MVAVIRAGGEGGVLGEGRGGLNDHPHDQQHCMQKRGLGANEAGGWVMVHKSKATRWKHELTNSGDSTSVAAMSEAVIPVSEAARDFLRVLDLVERGREAAILTRDGKPVATLSPLPGPVLTCADLAERWPKLDKLPPAEAAAFAEDLEQARASLPALKPAWD